MHSEWPCLHDRHFEACCSEGVPQRASVQGVRWRGAKKAAVSVDRTSEHAEQKQTHLQDPYYYYYLSRIDRGRIAMSFISAREHGAKPGSGGVASAQQEVRVSLSLICVILEPHLAQSIDRRERLRRLALETIDLAKDPYYMRNHLGQIECRLCLTIHPNEGNYLAHTQVRA